MGKLDNYECDGQLSLSECLNYRTLYPIPKLKKRWLDEEGWTDDWHYSDEETPKTDDYYFTFWKTNIVQSDSYTYTTALFYKGEWYLYNNTTKKWQQPFKWYKLLIGWVAMPSAYQQNETFISQVGADIERRKDGINH